MIIPLPTSGPSPVFTTHLTIEPVFNWGGLFLVGTVRNLLPMNTDAALKAPQIFSS